MWLFGSRVPALRARGTHPGWSSLAKHGIGFGPVLRCFVEMPMPRLLELQQMAEQPHAEGRHMVQAHWQQVRWRYSQEELGESPLPVLQRLLGGAGDGANAWI